MHGLGLCTGTTDFFNDCCELSRDVIVNDILKELLASGRNDACLCCENAKRLYSVQLGEGLV